MKKILLICLFLAITLLFTFPAGDADFGWHLRYGESFLKTGKVMRTNEFTWQMPDYQWANHSWGFDVIIATLFGGHRFWLISMAGGFLIAASMFIVINNPLTLGGLVALSIFSGFNQQLLNIGLRSQLFSLVGTAILWKLLRKLDGSSGFRRWHIAFPILFLGWANLHGQFIYGLGLMGLTVATHFLSTKPWPKRFYLVLLQLSCFLVTLINPFGYRLWTTAASHLNAPELKYINEWAPWPLTSPLMLLLIAFTGILWWGVSRTKQPRSIVLPLAAMTLLGLTSRRIIPYYLLVSLPILSQFIDSFIPKGWNKKNIPTILVSLFLIIAIFTMVRRPIFNQTWDTYCHSNVYCSEKATQFMRDNHITGKIWTAYRLGGYLDYRLPELKNMIDGRMTLWRNPDGSSAFNDYTQIVYAQKGSRELFMSENPDYVLIQPQYPLANVLKNSELWPVIYSDEQILLFKNPRLIPTPQP